MYRCIVTYRALDHGQGSNRACIHLRLSQLSMPAGLARCAWSPEAAPAGLHRTTAVAAGVPGDRGFYRSSCSTRRIGSPHKGVEVGLALFDQLDDMESRSAQQGIPQLSDVEVLRWWVAAAARLVCWPVPCVGVEWAPRCLHERCFGLVSRDLWCAGRGCCQSSERSVSRSPPGSPSGGPAAELAVLLALPSLLCQLLSDSSPEFKAGGRGGRALGVPESGEGCIRPLAA